MPIILFLVPDPTPFEVSESLDFTGCWIEPEGLTHTKEFVLVDLHGVLLISARLCVGIRANPHGILCRISALNGEHMICSFDALLVF